MLGGAELTGGGVAGDAIGVDVVGVDIAGDEGEEAIGGIGVLGAKGFGCSELVDIGLGGVAGWPNQLGSTFGGASGGVSAGTVYVGLGEVEGVSGGLDKESDGFGGSGIVGGGTLTVRESVFGGSGEIGLIGSGKVGLGGSVNVGLNGSGGFGADGAGGVTGLAM